MTQSGLIVRVAAKGEGATADGRYAALAAPGDVLADFGAVSEPVARMMAEGAMANSRANISVAITGVAGPGGGTRMKPVGTVHIACARENRAVLHEMLQLGDIGREGIRMAAVETALNLIQAQTR